MSSRLEHFKPQLKSGRINPIGKNLVFETDAPVDQIILPIETLDFISQCNGQLTLSEIIENIYRKKNTIQFKLVYQTLLLLKDKGLLENGHELAAVESFHFEKESITFLSFTPVWNFSLGRRIINDSTHPVLFYGLAILLCVSAILSLQNLSTNWFELNFLKINGSYATGVAFTFIAASLLLSAKNAIKATLLLFLTGRVYNLSLTFNGLAFYLRASSDSVFLIQNRFFIFLFHIANFFAYFAILNAVSFLGVPLPENIYSLGFVLLLFDSNPFQPSDVANFLRSLMKNDTLNRMSTYLQHKSVLALLSPYDSEQNKVLFKKFTWYAFIWSTLTVLFLTHALSPQILQIISALRLSEPIRQAEEWVSALMSLSVLVSLNLIIGYNLFKLIGINFNPRLSLARLISEIYKKNIRITEKDKDLIVTILQEFSLFSHLNSQVFEQILSVSQLKEVKNNAVILAPGEKCEHLHVLLMGQAHVEDQLVMAPAIFGEVGFLETPIQSQKITAAKASYILSVPVKNLIGLEGHEQFARQIETFKNSILVAQYFTNALLFRDLSENITRLFVNKGKIENFGKGSVLFKQGDLADGFYLLLKGSIEVVVNNRPVAQIHQGGFFGEISMIADIPRTATIYATQDCQTLRITREAFWEILAQDLNMAMFIESVGEMRVQEDVELLRTG